MRRTSSWSQLGFAGPKIRYFHPRLLEGQSTIDAGAPFLTPFVSVPSEPMSSISDLVCADAADSHSLVDDHLPSSQNLRDCAMEQLLDLGDAI